MNKTFKKILSVFVIVFVVDAVVGLLLMPFDLGEVIWPLINLPVLTVFPFQYLGVCTFRESLYLWPVHAGILAVAVYTFVVIIIRLAYNKRLQADAAKPND